MSWVNHFIQRCVFRFIDKKWLTRKLYSNCIWEMNDNNIYLTFDDGPHNELTLFVLSQLNEYNAKATFFCVGRMVETNRSIYQKIVQDGHAVGNHTYSHTNNLFLDTIRYFNDIDKAKKIIDTKLFRPAFGQITRSQVTEIKKRFNLNTVMWSVEGNDWAHNITGDECYEKIIKNAKGGSIILLHDNDFSEKTLRYVLPKLLAYFTEAGFKFKSIPSN